MGNVDATAAPGETPAAKGTLGGGDSSSTRRKRKRHRHQSSHVRRRRSDGSSHPHRREAGQLCAWAARHGDGPFRDCHVRILRELMDQHFFWLCQLFCLLSQDPSQREHFETVCADICQLWARAGCPAGVTSSSKAGPGWRRPTMPWPYGIPKTVPLGADGADLFATAARAKWAELRRAGVPSVFALTRGVDRVGGMFSKTDGRAGRASEAQLIQRLQEEGGGSTIVDGGLDAYSRNVILAGFAGVFDAELLLVQPEAERPSAYLAGEDELFVRGMWWMLRQGRRLCAQWREHRSRHNKQSTSSQQQPQPAQHTQLLIRQLKWGAMASGVFAGVRGRSALRTRLRKAKAGVTKLRLSRDASLVLDDVYRGCQTALPPPPPPVAPSRDDDGGGGEDGESTHSATGSNTPRGTRSGPDRATPSSSSSSSSPSSLWSREEDRAILQAARGKGNACHATFAHLCRTLCSSRTQAEVEARYNNLLTAYVRMASVPSAPTTKS